MEIRLDGISNDSVHQTVSGLDERPKPRENIRYVRLHVPENDESVYTRYPILNCSLSLEIKCEGIQSNNQLKAIAPIL
jgi:hypothetical protein